MKKIMEHFKNPMLLKEGDNYISFYSNSRTITIYKTVSWIDLQWKKIYKVSIGHFGKNNVYYVEKILHMFNLDVEVIKQYMEE